MQTTSENCKQNLVIPTTFSEPSRGPTIRIKPKIDTAMALQFIEMLGKGPHAWQAFDNNKKQGNKKLASSNWYGTFEAYKDRLLAMNQQGATVSICINENEGSKRDKKHIVKVRAIWVDTDGAPREPILDVGLTPHMIVESSPGKYHIYWLVDDCPVERFEGIMLALAKKFGCDEQVCKLQTVMRIPGFLHQKGEPFLSRIIEFNSDLPKYKTDDIISKFELVIKESQKQDAAPRTKPTSEEIRTCLCNNEDGDRDLFVQLQQENFCYDCAEKDWFKWVEHYWKRDDIEESFEAIGDVTDTYYREAKNQQKLRIKANSEGRPEKEKEHAKHEANLLKRTAALQTLSRKNNILKMATKGVSGLGMTGVWDSNPWLFPMINGVFDLQTGKFRPGKQSDYIQTVAPHEWRGIDAPAPTWEKFINDIIVTDKFEPDADTVDYLQRVFGYAISGLSLEHILLILWGELGRNGKSTLAEILNYVLGRLAMKISSETLLQSKDTRSAEAASPNLLSFRGKRLCFANETEQTRRLNVNLIKELTGGDTITARGLYAKRPTDFEPTHTTLLLTNNRPIIPVRTTDPIWDRVCLIPFHLKFVDHPVEKFERTRDAYLPDKLKTEAPGILAWLIRGFLAWKENGLKKSAAVNAATAKYKTDEDVTGRFINDRCVIDTFAKVKPGELYRSYVSWCEGQRIPATNQTVFGRDIGSRYDSVGEKHQKFYIGIGLATEVE